MRGGARWSSCLPRWSESDDAPKPSLRLRAGSVLECVWEGRFDGWREAGAFLAAEELGGEEGEGPAAADSLTLFLDLRLKRRMRKIRLDGDEVKDKGPETGVRVSREHEGRSARAGQARREEVRASGLKERRVRARKKRGWENSNSERARQNSSLFDSFQPSNHHVLPPALPLPFTVSTRSASVPSSPPTPPPLAKIQLFGLLNSLKMRKVLSRHPHVDPVLPSL